MGSMRMLISIILRVVYIYRKGLVTRSFSDIWTLPGADHLEGGAIIAVVMALSLDNLESWLVLLFLD